AWNPADIKKMALPPCHIMAQFYVHNEDKTTKKRSLSCHLYQRSGDMGLGVPFNIASYALFTHMIAHVTETSANELILSIGDAHVYKNHVEGLQLQVKRTPRMFPKIAFKSKKDRLEDFVFTDFVLSDYKPHDKIKLEIS
ncbi:9235_t:CDS:1, partial [Dentiscutata erythropus]